jgi:hypothetical protein
LEGASGEASFEGGGLGLESEGPKRILFSVISLVATSSYYMCG